MIQTYCSSGRFRRSFSFSIAALALPLLVVAALYQTLITFIPYIYANLFIAFGLSAMLHKSAEKAVRLGQCRNPFKGLMAGAALGLMLNGRRDNALCRFSDRALRDDLFG